jgi:hypothetical protein
LGLGIDSQPQEVTGTVTGKPDPGRMRTELIPDSGRLAGIVTAAELAKAGLTKAEIRVMVRREVLTPVRLGVYARAGVANPRLLAIAAAVVQVGHCAASHQDAAVVHGLDLLKRPPQNLISVSRPRRGIDGQRVGRPVVRIHSALMPTGHVIIRSRIPVTSVARTVIDVARVTPFRDGVVTADSALHQKKTTKDELRAVIAVMTRWPGIGRARDVVDFADGRAESAFESISRVAFRDAGLPPPKLQQWIDDGHGRLIGRVDFLWPEYKTIAEADGAAKYANPEKAIQQLERDTDLRDAGYEVVHYTWWELNRVPAVVIGRIYRSFRRQAATKMQNGWPAGSA